MTEEEQDLESLSVLLEKASSQLDEAEACLRMSADTYSRSKAHLARIEALIKKVTVEMGGKHD